MLKILPKNDPAKIYNAAEADQIIMSMKFILQGEKSAIALGILCCIQHKTPAWKIIKETQEMIRDNYTAMSRMLGGNLTERIKNF